MKRKELITQLVGINHKDAPLDLREQMAVPVEEQGDVMQKLMEGEESIQEGVLISTCNRVEMYYAAEDQEVDPERMARKLADLKEVDWNRLQEYLYTYQSEEAVHHLFRVASSLDSMVVGETQIINQVKTAYNEAKILGLTGKQFNPLFQEALSLAGEVQSETKLGENKVSVSSVAVDFVSKVFESLPQKTVLLVGAGETARICLEHLKDEGVEETIVCNRSLERAEKIADQVGAKTVQFDLLDDYLWQADVLIVATSSETPIIGVHDLEEALQKREHDPICVLDLSVPRNVNPACERLDQVYLYNVDDLESIVAENIESRSEEIDRAEDLVEKRTRSFLNKSKKDQLGPLIKALRKEIKQIGEEEIDRSLNRIDSLEEDGEAEVRQMVDRIVNKILHSPVANLKEEFARGDGMALAEALRTLFELEVEDSSHEEASGEVEGS